MLTARAALLGEYNRLHKAVLKIVHDDQVCRRLMSTPGVGPIVAITFKTAVDDPTRIAKSKAIGPLFGLTPRKYQSGETDVMGGVSCVGDTKVRTAHYEAANILLSRVKRFSALKRWGMDLAKRRGLKRAKRLIPLTQVTPVADTSAPQGLRSALRPKVRSQDSSKTAARIGRQHRPDRFSAALWSSPESTG